MEQGVTGDDVCGMGKWCDTETSLHVFERIDNIEYQGVWKVPFIGSIFGTQPSICNLWSMIPAWPIYLVLNSEHHFL